MLYNAYRAGQAAGKTPALCESGSSFQQNVANCKEYIPSAANSTYEFEGGVKIASSTTTANGFVISWEYTTFVTSIPSTSLGHTTISGPGAFLTSSASDTSGAAPGRPFATQAGMTSKAWIAGPVVGSAAGIAMVALLWLLLTRRWRRQRLGKSVAELGGDKPGEAAGEKKADVELHGNPLLAELDGRGGRERGTLDPTPNQQIQELCAGNRA
ncbi:hypothetical protein GGS23DRAFT_614392 [Durotheca rogersii]|uniref:uncharacterized protein n=1 Tax=Durotheca rogersii TaxID=419775 RepID=UPI0022206E8E|nr:uncharacterized protein GGS23DRAFT_614392 [Durotheca rogersii]KAI5859935.1 hypothetical protein GGS23DRAFT_614392 [Durotheca rogersii]